MSADESWSSDPRLDPYRDAVWALSLDGQPQAHLITRVTYGEALPRRRQVHDQHDLPALQDPQESLWSKVCWRDGRQERPEEDRGPDWYTVHDLAKGAFESESRPGLVFEVTPVHGPLRDRVWSVFGPP